MAAVLNQARSAVGSVARMIGRGMEKIGVALEQHPYQEHLLPSARQVAHKGVEPDISQAAFVAPTATAIGNVHVGKGASLWYGSVVRGDVNDVHIGSTTVVGDSAIIHAAGVFSGKRAVIGKGVIICPRATIHACTLEDNCMVGAGATVLDGAVVSKGAMVAPCATVSANTIIPEGQMWAGTPAAYAKDVSNEMLMSILLRAKQNYFLALAHAKECAKDVEEREVDEWKWIEQASDDPTYSAQVFCPESAEEDEDEYNEITSGRHEGAQQASPAKPTGQQ